jgi:hypothetical protein
VGLRAGLNIEATEKNSLPLPGIEPQSSGQSFRLQIVIYFFYPEGGVGKTQAWMPTCVNILRIPQI